MRIVSLLSASAVALTLAVSAGAAAPRAQQTAAPAAPADPADVAEGLRLWRTKADCQSCHGWSGDGRKMDTQMPDGANLRTTRTPRAGITMAIKCGRPGRHMPAFDRLAYSDGRCNGMTAADLKAKGLELPDPAATLQPREIDSIVTFLFEKVVGKGAMDSRAKCLEFWGPAAETCDTEFPQ